MSGIKRGEILKIRLNPIIGREQQGEARPCLVISHTKYNNARNGMVIVMPITKTIKPEVKTLIPLPTTCQIQGSVIIEQVRTLDLNQRWWKTTNEYLSDQFVDSVVNTFILLIGD